MDNNVTTVDRENFGVEKFHKLYYLFTKLNHTKIFIAKTFYWYLFFPVHTKYQWHMYYIMVLLRYLKATDGLLDL